MLVKARCEYCNSEDLRLIDMVYGKGTLGERIEKGFKCNSCDEELDLDEVIFEEIEELIERKIAREILTMIESVCFSEEYRDFRIDRGSNGQRDLIITKIKEQYLK